MSSLSNPLPLSMAALQALDQAGFVARLGGVVEHSPWVVERAWAQAPFACFDRLYDTLTRCIHSASRQEQLALLCRHPELAGREALAGTMTPDSSAEQARLGLTALSPQVMQRLTTLNRAYQARFGFPFVVALRLHNSLESVLLSGEERLRHDPDSELPIALSQVCEVMRGRLARAVHDNA